MVDSRDEEKVKRGDGKIGEEKQGEELMQSLFLLPSLALLRRIFPSVSTFSSLPLSPSVFPRMV